MKKRNAGDYMRTLSDRQLMARLRALWPEKYGEKLKLDLHVTLQHEVKTLTLTDDELKAELTKRGTPPTNVQD